MSEIVPAIIPKNLNLLKERLPLVAYFVKRVQIDFIDGKYDDDLSWPFSVEGLDEVANMVRNDEKFPFSDKVVIEADMMVLHPIEYLPDLLSLGVKSFVIHVDSTDHLKECISTIKHAGCEVGLGIKPSINSELLEPFILDVDFVQFMDSDNIGHVGVEVDNLVLTKIKSFHEIHPLLLLQADIGVNAETIPELKKAGVSRFVAGSAVFNNPNIKEAIEKLSSL